MTDALTAVLQRGASELLQQEAEVAEFIARYQPLRDERGRHAGDGLQAAEAG